MRSEYETVEFSRPKLGGGYEVVMHNESGLAHLNGQQSNSDTMDHAPSRITK